MGLGLGMSLSRGCQWGREWGGEAVPPAPKRPGPEVCEVWRALRLAASEAADSESRKHKRENQRIQVSKAHWQSARHKHRRLKQRREGAQGRSPHHMIQ
jgi:hypothetical protein